MKKKSILLAILSILILGAAYFYYNANLAPTKVAIINYPNFMETKMLKSNKNSWIKIKAFTPDKLSDLSSFDQILIFGMGIDLPKTEEEKLKKAKDEGISIYIQALTRPKLGYLANMQGENLDNIDGYINNGGTSNYKNMFNYIRREIDGKTAFTDTVIPPKKIPSEAFFYKKEEAIFETLEEFENYTKQNNIHKPNAPKVILFSSIPSPFNSSRDHLIDLIEELESRNFNVYPVVTFSRQSKFMDKIKPDLVVYMPHGRLVRGSKATEFLKKQNVPILCPVNAFQKYDDWIKNKQGLTGGILSQSVTMPEIDGGIIPYTVFAQYEDESGYLIFKAIPDRLKKFGQLAQNFMTLKDKKNKDKKIAIVYFKGPGKNALVASNMEVLPSLHNTLLRLQKEGYDLGNLPKDFETFKKDINQKGPTLGTYALGAFDNFLKNGDPELIEAETYNQWSKEVFPQELINEVEEKYGKAPGSYMGITKNNKDYLAVARVKYGNVVLLPQPLPAIGDNEFQLIHGAKVAPPHAYIAPYLWIQKGFKADAIFHFGTHGSLEFLPGKQIALSSYDWTDPLIGITPHLYIYTISNVGEGMIAKRRSYAITQTYLTPPFMKADALGKQEELHEKVHKYKTATGALKKSYAMSVKKMAVEQKINKDIDLDDDLSKPYTPEEMTTLDNYLEEIEHEKVTGGLYQMGVPYSNAKIDETVLMMMLNSLSYNLAEIDVQKGLVKRKKLNDKRFFNQKYGKPAETSITKIIKGASPEAEFNKLVNANDIARAEKWQAEQMPNHKASGGMFGRGKGGGKPKADKSKKATPEEKEKLKHLIIKIMPQQDKLDYIKKIESDKGYGRVISMLNPQKRQKMGMMAKMIPAMAKALEISKDQTIQAITILIQKQELRELALEYMNDKNLAKDVEAEKKRQNQALVKLALSPEMMSITSINPQSIKYEDLDKYKKIQNFYKKNIAKLKELLPQEKTNPNAKTLLSFIEKDFDEVNKKISLKVKQLETREMIFSQAVLQIKKTLNSISRKQKELKESPEAEMLTILNSLKGGYTAPSSGGDPISNPTTVPTGRNLYAIDTEKTPTQEAWDVAKKLTKSLLENYQKKHNKYPEKVSFTLWSSSFIETEGTTIGQILYLLGVRPIWDSFGRVKDIEVIPLKELDRPRIDVVVQTSGQLRDLAASRLFLINKAIALVSTLDEDNSKNFINKGISDAEQSLIEKGFSPKEARELSKQRVFGGVNGNYGTGIMGMVENSQKWDSTKAVAEQYIKNMGAVYTDKENWGEFNDGVFQAALLNTDAVVQPRQSNTWGALSLDHVYEFMGGLNLAVKHVTGNDAEAYFNDFRNSSNARVQGLHEAIWVESRTTLLNPKYIKELTKGGASSAEAFAETFRNTFGWNVMKPSVVENRLWDEIYDVYVKDSHKLNLHEFFERENPYALQEMTAVMLETIRKDMWKATPEQIKDIANLHAKLVEKHEAGCSGFVCDNMKLKNFISKQLDDKLKENYQKEIAQVREAPKREGKDAVVLKKEEDQNKIQPQNNANSFLKNKTLMIAIGLALVILIVIIIILRKRQKNKWT